MRPAGPRAVLPLLAALLAAYLAAPFLAAAGQIGTADLATLSLPDLARAAMVSIGSATAATVLVALGGIPLGYLLARSRSRWTGALSILVQLPLALPPLASGILLLFLLGYASPLGRLTHGALTDSFAGIVLSEAFVAAPFLVIAARSGFAAVDPVLEDVAATLGHRGWAVFFRVSMALAWRGIAAGLLLTWLRAFGEFGATVMVAYHPYSLPVFTYVAFGSAGLPAMLPVLAPTLLVAILVILASQAMQARPRRPEPPAEPMPAATPVPLVPPARSGPMLDFGFTRGRTGFLLDVSWRTDARRLAILGASGSGKSATLRLIAGLDRGDSAHLALGDRILTDLPAWSRRIAYLPQGYGLLPHLVVDRQVRFSPGCDSERARHWINRLGLGALGHRLPSELSPGQQQRVALARALSRPDATLLLLDEPFSALDASLRGRLRQDLLVVQRDLDLTTILVTHDPADALLLADEIMLLEAGRVLQRGPIGTVFLRPVSERAARLLGAENIARGEALNWTTIAFGNVLLRTGGPALAPGPVGIAIRPEAVRVGSVGLPATILCAEDRRDGVQRLLLRIGTIQLSGTPDHAMTAEAGPCRVLIDTASMQVWPIEMEGNASR